MQALAAEFSGYAEDSAAVFRGKGLNRLFGFPSITALKVTRSVCFKSFLARNELVAPRFG
jgi:hypothetical protein